MKTARREAEMFDEDDITDPDIGNSDSEATRLVKLALSKLEEGSQGAKKARTAASRLKNVCTVVTEKP